MKKKLLFLLISLFSASTCAQQFRSQVLAEDRVPANTVLVVNITKNLKTFTDTRGSFTIDAEVGDELRFVKHSYDRKSIIVTDPAPAYIVLNEAETVIEEVKIAPVNLTGNLKKDAALLARTDYTTEMRKNIGVPEPPEKPREKVADVKKDVLLPILAGRLNVQALYDVVSGDARRKKQLYQFQDGLEVQRWILIRTGTDYYINLGIPKEKISVFLDYALAKNPEIEKYVRAKNIVAVQLRIEAQMPSFLTQTSK